MAKKPQRTAKRDGTQPAPEVVQWAKAFALLGKVADRFGVTFAVFVVLIGAVKWFGDAKTQNDFVRELLFRDVTHTPYLSIFFAVIIFNIVFGFAGWRRYVTSESKEMQRIADVKSRLQERQLGRTLQHTRQEATIGNQVPGEDNSPKDGSET